MTLQDVPKLKHTHSNNFFLLCGPCAIEGEDMAFRIAEKVVNITNRFEVDFLALIKIYFCLSKDIYY